MLTKNSILSSENLIGLGLLSIVLGIIVGLLPSTSFLMIAMMIALIGVWAILKQSDLGVVAALIVAGVLAEFLRLFQIIDSGSGDIRLAGIVALSLLGITSISLYLAHFLKNHRMSIVCKPLPFLLLGGFVVLNLVGVGYGAAKYGAMEALLDANWIVWIGFFAVIVLNPSLRLIKYLAISVFCISLFQSLVGVVRLVQGQGTINLSTGGQRYVAGSTSLLIAAGVIVSAILVVYVARTRFHRILYSAAIVLQIVGLALSFNRQTWFALGISLFLGSILFFKGNRWKLIGSIVVFVGVFVVLILLVDSMNLFSIRIQDEFIRRIAGGSLQGLELDPSFQFRLSAWNAALSEIWRTPIFGTGWGSPFFFSIVVPRTGMIQAFDSSPHNTPLWLAYKTGLPSLFLYFSFYLTLFFNAINILLKTDKNQLTVVYYCLLGSFLIQILYFVGSFFWDYMSVMYMSVPVWINTGLLATLVALGSPSHKTSRNSVLRSWR